MKFLSNGGGIRSPKYKGFRRGLHEVEKKFDFMGETGFGDGFQQSLGQ